MTPVPVPPPLGLYVHLPWCERKCPYCDFNSHEGRDIPEAAYVDALLDDLDGDLALLQRRAVETVFIGGGTPSLFSVDAIRRLIEGVAARLTLAGDAEITLEANPGSAEAARFAGYRQAGINRISLGIQSFDDECLRRLGRVHDGGQARLAVEALHKAGFQHFNLDLMHGLPGQSATAACDDISTALGFDPPHLSWYELTIEPNTVFHKFPPRLPDEDVLARQDREGEVLLCTAGLENYEISAWARPGGACRHNLNYWRFGDYIGIGAGAHGKLTQEDGSVLRYARTRAPEDYLRATRSQFATQRILSPDALKGEFMLNALRLREGFRLEDFRERTGLDAAALEPALGDALRRGLLIRDGEGVRTTALGRRYLDSVVGSFFDP